MSSAYILILTNCRDDNEADYLMEKLFEDKLAACVQTNKVHSHFYSKGKVVHDSEIRMMIKTKKSLYKQCEETIRNLHSYDIPEIIELPITDGSKHFFDWVEFATQ